MFWKSLAILQTLFWFFALPVFLKPYWVSFWAQFTPLQSQILMSWTGLPYFFYYALTMLPIYQGNYSFFEQYKISDKEWAWKSEKKETRDEFWTLSKRSLGYFFFNYGILVPFLTTLKYYILGDNMSFTVEDWPSYQTLFIHNILLSVIHEFFFYWAHRIGHHPSIYRFHKVHHEYKQNTILAAQHEHPVDYILSIASPALLAVSLVSPHSFTTFQWLVWTIFAHLDDHLGYAFPWSPVRWFPLSSSTEMHEFHHSNNIGCYSSKLRIYDWIFGSDQHYLKWMEKRKTKNTTLNNKTE